MISRLGALDSNSITSGTYGYVGCNHEKPEYFK